MDLLLQQSDVQIDGFILPGHVCAIIGFRSLHSLCGEVSFPDGS